MIYAIEKMIDWMDVTLIRLKLFLLSDFRIGIPIVKHISKIVGIHWEISGKEILAKDFPCVIICNHQSAWDFMRKIF